MIQEIVEQHASEAALLWALRDAAATEPHYDLEDLAHLDDRVEAHLDGLRIAGDAAWPSVKAAVESGLDDGKAGEVFAATAIATDHGDLEGIARILDLAGESPILRRGMVSAMGWLPFEVTSAVLPGLLDPGCPPPLTLLGIAACAAHRSDPGPALGGAFFSDHAPLRSYSMRAAGLLGRRELAAPARAHLEDPDETCRFSAALALALLGDAQASVEALWQIATRDGIHADRACLVALRRGDPAVTRGWLEGLSRLPPVAPASRNAAGVGAESGVVRRAIQGAGALGDPALVPWLLERMEEPTLARLAGESLTLITGVDLEARPLRGAAPEGFSSGPSDDPEDDDVAMDPDSNLPWPDVVAVKRWWSENRGHLRQHVRHLLGKAISPEWLSEVLRRGTQRQRAAAALEITFLHPGRPLFEVRAPGFRQRRALAGGGR